MNRLSMILLLAVVLFSCKKEEPVALPNPEGSIVGFDYYITGSVWTNVNPGGFFPGNIVRALYGFDNELLITMSITDTLSMTYDGSNVEYPNQTYSSMGGGNGIYEFEEIDGELYGIGYLGNHGLYRYDRSQYPNPWQPVGGVSGFFNSVTKHNGNFVACGSILPRIRILNGANWEAFPQDINGQVKCIKSFNGELIAAGIFGSLGNIARWDSGTNSWQTLGAGLNGSVFDLEIMNDVLYVAGAFTATLDGDTTCRFIAAWDGTEWKNVDGGLTGNFGVQCLLAHDNQLFIGGEFDSGGGVFSRNVIKWTESLGYATLGNGVSDPIGAMAIFKNRLYVTNFSTSFNGDFIMRLDPF